MNDALARRAARQQNDSTLRLLGAVLLLALLVSGGASAAEPSSTNSTKDRPMNHYALIFRQRPGDLTAEELERRLLETRAWAEAQNAAGHALDPRILTAESERLAPPGGTAPSNEVPVTAILFLEARDLADAVAVARAHPALRFGASIEVRPWAPPPPRAAARP